MNRSKLERIKNEIKNWIYRKKKFLPSAKKTTNVFEQLKNIEEERLLLFLPELKDSATESKNIINFTKSARATFSLFSTIETI